MNKAIGVSLLIIGVVLLILGFTEARSFESEVARVFTGSPTDRSIWFLIGGAVAAGLGLFFVLSRPR